MMKIATLLRKNGEPDALQHMMKSLHLDPTPAAGWKVLGMALTQDRRLMAARAAFGAAVARSAPGEDLAARTGLATVLAQLGLAGAAADEMLTGTAPISHYSSPIPEHFERLCRRLMPGHRFAALQSAERASAWEQALVSVSMRARVLCVSSTPLPAMLAARAGAILPVLRAETLPLTLVREALDANLSQLAPEWSAEPLPSSPDASSELHEGQRLSPQRQRRSTPPVQLLAAGPDGLPMSRGLLGIEGSPPGLLLADTDAFDILSSPLLPLVAAAKSGFMRNNATVVPCALEVHAVLVDSAELLRLNAISGSICGLELDMLNSLAHRTRAIRLMELQHCMLTAPTTVLWQRLDGADCPATTGEVEVEVTTVGDGTAHALVVWHTLQLTPLYSLSTAPSNPDPSIKQVAHFLESPDSVDGELHVLKGTKLKISLRWRPRHCEFEVHSVPIAVKPSTGRKSPSGSGSETPPAPGSARRGGFSLPTFTEPEAKSNVSSGASSFRASHRVAPPGGHPGPVLLARSRKEPGRIRGQNGVGETSSPPDLSAAGGGSTGGGGAAADPAAAAARRAEADSAAAGAATGAEDSSAGSVGGETSSGSSRPSSRPGSASSRLPGMPNAAPARPPSAIARPPAEARNGSGTSSNGGQPPPTQVGEHMLSEFHFAMLADSGRNDAFYSAIIRKVTTAPPRLVLDIGCGTGLLSMCAARAGARRVLALEMSPELATIATRLVAQHDLEDNVRVLPCHSSWLTLGAGNAAGPRGKRASATEHYRASQGLPAVADDEEEAAEDAGFDVKADLLVFEILGTDPLCEGLLPTLRDARERLLAPDARVIPGTLEVHAALVDSADLARLNSVGGKVGGLELSALNALSHKTRAIRLSGLEHTMLTRPCTALRLALDADVPPPPTGEHQTELVVQRSGPCHAVVSWFTAVLDADKGTSISTAPGVAEPFRGYSWGQLVNYLPSPDGMPLSAGETLDLHTRWSDKGLKFDVVRRKENRGTAPPVRAADPLVGQHRAV